MTALTLSIKMLTNFAIFKQYRNLSYIKITRIVNIVFNKNFFYNYIFSIIMLFQNLLSLNKFWKFLLIKCQALWLCACSQLCLTLCNPVNCSLPGSLFMEFSR